ncbi:MULTISPECIES: helix-turn-helix domain-containing protein [unclassified Sedimentibacter]|uniref:helix-turn-helix domain-containing protein n=1 Tax=unclassified Sedimentibacter TaxID=2649220 RepID=UPI0027E161A9|nr:helix-turn-helix transcriptional regulator [Sedimentibacter sp. MB35-C1]WMJ78956.1 helix-turn-helix transcriptional regulator [Sedimentibacter sp. MB35-C1]
MKIDERIRYLRTKYNLTSKELSKALNVSESSISLYESGKRRPSVDLIVKMAYYFDVSTDFILGISDSYEKNKLEELDTDYSELLNKIISSLNGKNCMIFNGDRLDSKIVIIFKNNLNLVLENMNMIVSK